MKFNKGYEWKKFEEEWKRLRGEYAAAGMDETAIDAMYEFDRGVFNSNRRYAEHTQEVSPQVFSDDGDRAEDGNTALLLHFLSAFSVEQEDIGVLGRYSWVEKVDSPVLYRCLSGLSDSDREILTLWVFEGYSASEIARMQGSTQQNISKKICRLKRIIKNSILGL